MTERYEPASDFLKRVIAEEVPLSGSAAANTNMEKLVALTRDEDTSNRDWATMLLGSQDGDTPAIRAALLSAARDECASVRAEALAGIARRDKALALPLVAQALRGETASMAVFEAAELIADPALIDLLRPWAAASGDEWLDQLARDALAACEKGTSTA